MVDVLDHPSLRILRSDLPLQEVAVPHDHAEKVVKIMGNTPCQLAYRLHFLGLSEPFVHLFRVLACRNIANIALDYALAIYSAHVADELDVDAAPTLGFQWQVPVSDIFLILQLLKSCLRCFNMSEWANVPKRSANKVFSGIIRSEEHTSELQSLRHLVCR